MMQKNNIEIRIAEMTDIPSLARLEEECFSAPWSENALSETMSREETAFFVAVCDGRVCGYIGSYYVLDEGYITNVAVSSEYRRRGIGKALITSLIKKGRKLGLSFLTLEVRVSNVGAISLYEEAGFKDVGIRPRFYDNPCEDARLMTYYY